MSQSSQCSGSIRLLQELNGSFEIQVAKANLFILEKSSLPVK